MELTNRSQVCLALLDGSLHPFPVVPHEIWLSATTLGTNNPVFVQSDLLLEVVR